MSLFDSLSKISEQIHKQRHLMTTEAATKQVSVNPFILSLGYNITNLTEVQPEYSADAKVTGGDKVDYAIMRNGKPIILIEAKTANIDLNENHWKQLHHYFVALDAEFGILTNGIEYQFYTDQNKQHVMDKTPFLTLDMLKLDAQLVNVLEGFSKTLFDPLLTVRKLKIFGLVEKEYKQPSDDFVKHFAKQIHSGGLYKKHIKEFAPIVRQAWWDLVDKEIAQRLRRHEENDQGNIVCDRETEPSPLEPSGNILAPSTQDDTTEVPVYAVFRKQRFEAALLLDGFNPGKSKVRYKGEELSPSAAGKKVKLSVDPSLNGATNGWGFWKLRDPGTNREHTINKLRRDREFYRKLLAQS